jgi:PAS domain
LRRGPTLRGPVVTGQGGSHDRANVRASLHLSRTVIPMEANSHTDEHPRFRRLADYLASKAPPGKLPGRQHVEPTEIPDLLPWLMLVEVIAQADVEPYYRIRLVGTEVVGIQGRDGTGKYVEEVLNKTEAATITQGYGEIVGSQVPGYRQGMVATVGREHVSYRRIAFRLTRDGEGVNMLMFVFVRDDKPLPTARREDHLPSAKGRAVGTRGS